jgi:hypothetical protein
MIATAVGPKSGAQVGCVGTDNNRWRTDGLLPLVCDDSSAIAYRLMSSMTAGSERTRTGEKLGPYLATARRASSSGTTATKVFRQTTAKHDSGWQTQEETDPPASEASLTALPARLSTRVSASESGAWFGCGNRRLAPQDRQLIRREWPDVHGRHLPLVKIFNLFAVLRQALDHLIELLAQLPNVVITFREVHSRTQIPPPNPLNCGHNSSGGRCTSTSRTESDTKQRRMAKPTTAINTQCAFPTCAEVR